MFKNKFYETQYPYYGLIMAESKELAMKEYELVIADNVNNELDEYMIEVDPIYAIAKYSRTNGEDGNIISIKEVIEDLHREEPLTMIIDGCLL